MSKLHSSLCALALGACTTTHVTQYIIPESAHDGKYDLTDAYVTQDTLKMIKDCTYRVHFRLNMRKEPDDNSNVPGIGDKCIRSGENWVCRVPNGTAVAVSENDSHVNLVSALHVTDSLQRIVEILEKKWVFSPDYDGKPVVIDSDMAIDSGNFDVYRKLKLEGGYPQFDLAILRYEKPALEGKRACKVEAFEKPSLGDILYSGGYCGGYRYYVSSAILSSYETYSSITDDTNKGNDQRLEGIAPLHTISGCSGEGIFAIRDGVPEFIGINQKAIGSRMEGGISDVPFAAFLPFSEVPKRYLDFGNPPK